MITFLLILLLIILYRGLKSLTGEVRGLKRVTAKESLYKEKRRMAMEHRLRKRRESKYKKGLESRATERDPLSL